MARFELPKNSSILMIGSPGIGLLEFNVGLAQKYLEKGEKVVFVTIDCLPSDLLSLLESFGVDPHDVLGTNLFIVDYHSSLLGGADIRSKCDDVAIRRVSDIEGIMFNLLGISEQVGTSLKVFVHSLSTLFLYNQANVVLKFFQISSSRIRSEVGMAVFTVHDGVHDDRTVNHLMAMADGVIELKFDEHLNRKMRIRHMRGQLTSSQWIPFEIKQLQDVSRITLLEWGQ
ncbi:MAG: ATPase domain-containing protein [Methanomassiliicoccales archaeon]